jgi:hypothetical protein
MTLFQAPPLGPESKEPQVFFRQAFENRKPHEERDIVPEGHLVAFKV